MAGNISFSTIPQNIRPPLFYVEFSAAANNLNQSSQRTLLIGHTVNAQSELPVFISNATQAYGLFGNRSQLADMVAHYLETDPVGTVFCLPVTAGGGEAAAEGTITVTGPATANGTISLYVAGTLVQVGVTSGSTANTIAAAINAAVGASVFLPVTSSVTTNVVTLTAVHGGVIGNHIDVRVNFHGTLAGEALPAGVALAIVQPTGGTGVPDLSTVATIIGDENFDFIVCPFSDTTSLSAMTAMMQNATGRWAFNRQSYGHVFSAFRAAGAGVSGYGAAVASGVTLGAALNDSHLTVMFAYDSPTSAWATAAEYAGAFATSSRADPARPTQTLTLPGVLAAPIGSRLAWADMNTLLQNGMAVTTVAAGDAVQIMRSVTTYQFNTFGVADQSFLDSETLFTLMYITRFLKAQITQKYSRSKLADDGTAFGAGSNIITPKVIKAELIASYQGLIDNGVVEDTADFAKGLIVQRNTNDPSRIDVLYDPYLVSGLRIFAVINQFALQAPTF